MLTDESENGVAQEEELVLITDSLEVLKLMLNLFEIIKLMLFKLLLAWLVF